MLAEGDGRLGSVCIYQAESPEAIQRHADAAELPVDEVIPVADTVIVRPDPEPAQALGLLLLPLGLAQLDPADLAGQRLRQVVHELDLARVGVGGQVAAHELLDLVRRLVASARAPRPAR